MTVFRKNYSKKLTLLLFDLRSTPLDRPATPWQVTLADVYMRILCSCRSVLSVREGDRVPRRLPAPSALEAPDPAAAGHVDPHPLALSAQLPLAAAPLQSRRALRPRLPTGQTAGSV